MDDKIARDIATQLAVIADAQQEQTKVLIWINEKLTRIAVGSSNGEAVPAGTVGRGGTFR